MWSWKQRLLIARWMLFTFLLSIAEEKERYLDRLDDQFGSLAKQINKYDESKYDILTLLDPKILTKFDLVKANIEVCRHSLCIHEPNLWHLWVRNRRIFDNGIPLPSWHIKPDHDLKLLSDREMKVKAQRFKRSLHLV